MEYYGNNDYRDYLSHHGILGMKWGKKNGPPYPLSGSAHSASEKKAGWRKSLSSHVEGVKKKVKASVKTLPSRVKKIHDAAKVRRAVAKARAEEKARVNAQEKAAREKAMWENLDKWNTRLSKVNNYTNTVLNTVNNVQNIRKKINDAQAKNTSKLSEQYVKETLKEFSGKKASELDKTDLLNRVAVANSLEKLEKLGGSSLGNYKFNNASSKSSSYTYTRSDTTSGSDTKSSSDSSSKTVGDEASEYSYGKISPDSVPKTSVDAGKSSVKRTMKSMADIGKHKVDSLVADEYFRSESVDTGMEALYETIKKFHK